MVKRGLDLVLSALLLCLTAPILLVSAFIVYVSSPGPVLFRQQRMGRGFQPFEIIKLRTMTHAEAGLAYTLGPDPRITFFGKWLRATKVDELPQLWNVLRGEMSLVGPRPVIPQLTEEFPTHYRLLLRVRPGLTDPASLKYCQEARLLAGARDPLHFFKTVVTPDKINLSLEYMETADVWSDVMILVMTGIICCLPSLARVYGTVPRPEALFASPPTQLVARTQRQRPLSLPRFDQSLFSHALAELEASEEAKAASRKRAWNQRPSSAMGMQSTASSVEQRVSHL